MRRKGLTQAEVLAKNSCDRHVGIESREGPENDFGDPRSHNREQHARVATGSEVQRDRIAI